jgi:hypothetical protein
MLPKWSHLGAWPSEFVQANSLVGMVGSCGLEPQTSSVSRTRSNQLSYGPIPIGATLSVQWDAPNLLIAYAVQSAAPLPCQRGDYKYLQQLTRLLGTAKYLIIRRGWTHLRLAFGLKCGSGQGSTQS